MNQPKKIAILCNFPIWIANPEFPASSSHYATWLTTLYDSFEHQNLYEIHWVILEKAIKKPQRFISKKQHFHIIPRISRTVSLYTFFIYERLAIRRELNQIKPHIVHTWGTEDCYGLCGKDAKNVVWLHTVQGLLKTYMARGPMARYHRHLSTYEPGVLRKAKWITTESPWAAEQVRVIAPKATPMLWDYAVESQFYQAHRSLSPTPMCLYCGTDVAIKNIDTLIKVFSRPELSNVQLILAGPAPDKWKNLPPNIKALGRLNRQELSRYMSQAWCLVHLSKADTGPTVVKEARVMGLPVILTDACGSKQYVEHNKSGFIVSPCDIKSVVKSVLHIIESKEKSLSMGKHGQNFCRDVLTPEHMVNGLLNIYDNLTKISN